ncbi:type II toxin-antitoxin system RelE/ParE family toxin [Longimicrobium sp.]|jgi:hypothetical protein|uniref:type II toxin-antitoxin system RelE/ParE family toxin n=1 Tax=Longimicrobium sp. TaxID=2029185 RepID=UPI002ED7DA78
MLFVESSLFERARKEYLADDGLRELQAVLLARPDAGVVIPGTGGVRKLRWKVEGRGKRGGLRVIYYVRASAFRCYLLHLYSKNVEEDLSPAMRKALAALVHQIEAGE